MKNMTGMTKSAIQCEATFTLNVDVQNALDDQSEGPEENLLSQWANLAYEKAKTLNVGLVDSGELDVTIRVVEAPEITQLNRDYRGKDKATNVLSFPFENDMPELPVDMSDEWGVNLLGDVVICHSVIAEEAQQQSKSVADHYAHMIVHGILHLCGYDHLDDETAEEMEGIEVAILSQKQIANPYL